MANEELFKRLGKIARTEAGGGGTPPAESAPKPEVPPKEAKPKFSEVVSVAKESLAEFAKKVKEGVPEAAQKIIGEQGDYPQDARVFAVIEGLLTADEAQLGDATFMRGVGEKLVGIVSETGFSSVPGREARKYLNRIVAESPSLNDLRIRAEETMLPISGGSGLPEEEAPGGEEIPEEIAARLEEQNEIKNLYDKTGGDPLEGTPLAAEIKSLQYRLEVDPDSILYDNRLVSDAIKRITEVGEREHVDKAKVQDAVFRVRAFESYATEQYQKRREKEQGSRAVRWKEIKGTAPKSDLHKDDEVFPEFRYISPAEVDKIVRGAEGEAEWYFNLIDQIYSLGREETRPTLSQDQMFHEFKQFLLWKYGDEYPLVVQEYQKHWDSRGQFEYAVKGLMYNPGDVKDRLKAMSLLTGADLDYLYKNFNHSNEAYNLYEHVMFELMAEKRAAYGKSLDFLKSKATGVSLEGALREAGVEVSDAELKSATQNIKSMLKRYEEMQDTKDKKVPDTIKKIKEKYHNNLGDIAFEDLLEVLRQEQREELKGVTTTLTPLEQKLFHHIQKKMDLASEGVMLWDSDVQSFTELHITMTKLQSRKAELEGKKAKGTALTQSEMDELSEVNRLYTIYSQRESQLNENFTQELLQTRGLSPVDIEVRKRLVEYLKAQNGGKEPPEYEIRMALWASRTAMIASGRMAAIGAMMSVMPGVEYGTLSGKHVMRAPAFEDLQRIFNPETFAKRFNIGGDMGLVARSILRKNLLRTKDIVGQEDSAITKQFKKMKLTKSREWGTAKSHEHDPDKRVAMEAMEFAEDATGISFSELLGPGIMATGGFYDGTGWRLDKGIVDSLRDKMLAMKKLPDGASLLDNQALSIQLLTSGTAAERRPILDRMLKRNPSKFLELLVEDREDILKKNGINPTEWAKFKEALSLAEMKMAHNKEWQFKRIDLASSQDFKDLMAPFLKSLGIADGRMEAMRKILVDLQEVAYKPQNVKISDGTTFGTKMDAIAHKKLPLTMSLTDFDWKESNFYQLGTVAMHRRIRDVGAQMRARDGILDIIGNSEMLLSPNDYTKSLEKMREIRDAIVDYSGADAAENTVKEMARVLLEMNRDRSLWSLPGILGLKGVAKMMAESDLRVNAPARNRVERAALNAVGKFMQFTVGGAAKLSHKVPVVENVLEWAMPGWKGFSHEPFEKWPHSIAEAISYSIRYTGAHGNVWDEFKMEEVINTMHDMGLFINHPEHLQDLRLEFSTRVGDRWFAAIRKYWWVVPIATIAIATEQGMEEQKKGGGGGGH